MCVSTSGSQDQASGPSWGPAGPSGAGLKAAGHAPRTQRVACTRGGVHMDGELSLGAARTRRSSKKARHPAAPRYAVFRWILSPWSLLRCGAVLYGAVRCGSWSGPGRDTSHNSSVSPFGTGHVRLVKERDSLEKTCRPGFSNSVGR